MTAPVPTSPSADGEPIVGAPVVGIATHAAAPKLIRCARCHGHSAEGTRFCKYCGAPLEEPNPAARADSEEVSAIDMALRPVGRIERTALTLAASPVASSATSAASAASAASLPATTNALKTGRLVVIAEDGTEGKVFPLESSQVDIGRTDGDIVLKDDFYVSPRHARLVFQGEKWFIRDLHSTNGVYRRLWEPHVLKDGDLLLLGLEVLQFETVSDAERGLGHASQHGTLLFGSPSLTRRARLCQRTVEGIIRDVHHLFRDETVIGREVGDIVFTADPFLSRRHAAIRKAPMAGTFTLTDLDSSNGTFVAIRGDVPLNNGDYLRVGQHLFRVDLA
jgi:pSer/pThr/pTyr-binding forkhead associated (FHA) protein